MIKRIIRVIRRTFVADLIGTILIADQQNAFAERRIFVAFKPVIS
jgi:hypothetical protein